MARCRQIDGWLEEGGQSPFGCGVAALGLCGEQEFGELTAETRRAQRIISKFDFSELGALAFLRHRSGHALREVL